MLKKNVSLLILIVGFLLLMYYIVINIGNNVSYDLQLGYEPSQEFVRMSDHKTEFENNKRLIALAIYPDKRPSLLRAQLYVTRKGDVKILQNEEMIETKDLAGFEMILNNINWPVGEYTLYFKRGLEIEKSLDFTLK